MSMPTRNIGSLEVTVVGVGCNNFGARIDEVAAALVVKAAFDAGINFFDTADIYGGTRSEEILGRALGSRRADAVVATKFGMTIDDTHRGAAPAYVHRALDDSLRRLGTDWIDLYQLHAPDPSTPIADTLGAMDEAVRAGKVREIGCSNFSAEQLAEASASAPAGHARFVSVQNQYSILCRTPEQDVLDRCQRDGLVFLPYYPLARGLLTGKYRAGQPPPAGTRLASLSDDQYAKLASERNLAAVQALEALASDHGRSLVELAVAWLLSRPTVASVIAGATSPPQVAANATGADWNLDAGVLDAVDAVVGTGVALI